MWLRTFSRHMQVILVLAHVFLSLDYLSLIEIL